MWITEFGYKISHEDGGKFVYPTDGPFDTPGTVTPLQQAAYTIRMNMAAARHDIGRVYHMSALDTDNFNGGWFGNGPQGDPRPVAVAMRQLIQLLRAQQSLTVILDGEYSKPEKPYAYVSPPPAETCWWRGADTGGVQTAIEPDTETVVTDMLGNTIAKVTDSYFTAQLSENPIFH